VMKGKNVGRTIKRASRLPPAKNPRAKDQAAIVGLRVQTATDGVDGIERPTAIRDFVQPQVGHQFTGYALSMDLSLDYRRIIHQCAYIISLVETSLTVPDFTIIEEAKYTLTFSNPCLSGSSAWGKYLNCVWDEACKFPMNAVNLVVTYIILDLATTLCLMEVCNDFYLNRPTMSPPTLKHMSKAFTLVNKKLSSDEALSDATLLMVLALVIVEQLHDEPQRWRVHLQGLFRIVELRGGLAQYRDTWELAHKICRADIDFALSTGSRPQMQLDNISFILEESACSLNNNGTTLTFPKVLNALHSVLQGVAKDSVILARRVNGSVGGELHYREFQANVISICYRLLDFSSLNSPVFNNTLDLSVYLGLTAFVVTIMLQFGNRRFLRQQLLEERLRSFLLHEDYIGQNRLDSSLMLWLLFIGRLSILEDGDETWLLPRMAMEIDELGIEDLPGLFEQLTLYPWIDILYNRTVERTWNCIQGSRNSGVHKAVVR
jgi:hypothetical protein